MKYKKAKLPFTDLINRNKFISSTTYGILNLFFLIVRFFKKLIKNKDGPLVIIALHRLGDTIFTIPAIRQIYKRYGKKIIILCFPESFPIYSIEFDDIQYCLLRQDEFLFGQRLARHSAKSKLRNLKPEIILDLTGSMISASLIYNIKAKQIIGINREQFSSIYDNYISYREEPKLVDMYLDGASPLIELPNRADFSEQKKQFSPFPSGRILIHPFAGWKEKEWSLKSIISLAIGLNKNYRLSLIIQNNQLSSDVIDELDHLNIDLIQTNSVEELIKSIMECSLFIGNDSGPVNIANFLGKPTFSIYGATNPDYTASEEDHQRYIQKKINCSAKLNEKYCKIGVGKYDCPGIQCMNLLTVDEVYNTVIPLIEEYCNKRS
ncbi:MAG: glycosyltransferase family 9 protein [Ignavibacteriaceae bacterium]|jgi:ADP-heptose:LPS heptosyltransferase|nr:glycosyltransferase family 9 protein [Ignavibacteriaceae bacterium]